MKEQLGHVRDAGSYVWRDVAITTRLSDAMRAILCACIPTKSVVTEMSVSGVPEPNHPRTPLLTVCCTQAPHLPLILIYTLKSWPIDIAPIMIFYEADTYTYYDQSLMSRPPYLTEEKQAQVLNILTDVSWTSDDKVNGLIALFSDSYDARDVEGSRSYIAGLLEQLRSDREMQHRFEAFWDSVNSV